MSNPTFSNAGTIGPAREGSRDLAAILTGGLIAGTIDIGAASLINLINPLIILQAIASGLIGRSSYSGGVPTAVLGLLLQWLMGLIIAAVFVVASRRLTILKRRWVTFGLLYGIAIYLVMNFVVVPLSAAHFPLPRPGSKAALDLLAMLLFGLIVSFFAQRVRTRSAPA